MPRTSENPRYNVLSCRVDDATWDKVQAASGHRPASEFIRIAIEEKLIADNQARFDAVVKGM